MKDSRGPVMFGSEVEFNGIVKQDGKWSVLGTEDEVLKILSMPFLDESFKLSCKNGALSFFWLNGGRFYKDSADGTLWSLEGSTPEVKSIKDLVIYEEATVQLADEWSRMAAEEFGWEIDLFKNICFVSEKDLDTFLRVSRLKYEDKLEESFGVGYHGSYLLPSFSFFEDLTRNIYNEQKELFRNDKAANFASFLITQNIYTGAGLSLPYYPWFFRSQRACFIKKISRNDINTRYSRPLICGRNESLMSVATDSPYKDYRRLHIVCNDANMSEYATFLKFITISLVLAVLKEEAMKDVIIFADPLGALRESIVDLSCKKQFGLKCGRKLSFLEVQRIFLNACLEFFGRNASGEISLGLDMWGDILDRIERGPLENTGRMLDWVIVYNLMVKSSMNKGLNWADPMVRAIDLSYRNTNKEKGLYYLLLRKGLIERISTDAEAEHAKIYPPIGTRGGRRGKIIRETIRRGLGHTSSWREIKTGIPCESAIYTRQGRRYQTLSHETVFSLDDDIFDDSIDDVVVEFDKKFSFRK